MKIPHRRSEEWVEQSSLSQDTVTGSAPGDPAGRTCAARTWLDPPPAATLSSPRPGPVLPRTGQRDRPDSCGSRHFRIPAALHPEWHAGAGREGRFTQSGGGYERLGRSRAPHAECGPGGIFSAVSPGPARTAVRRQPHRAARASPRPPPEAPARESRTGGRSLPPAIPYSFTSACRHRYPPDPGNAQAVPGINLRVNSQTNIRAQLVKQS